MPEVFHIEYGYLVRNKETGEIDTESHWPRSHLYARDTELVEGFEWVKVALNYTLAE